MRLRVRRRKILNITIKILSAALITLLIYLCLKPHSRNSVSKEKSVMNTKILIVEREIDAISMLHNITREFNPFSSNSGTVISISSHFTDDLYLLRKPETYNFLSLTDVRNRMKQISLESISKALTGLFSKIIWIYPMWIPNSNIFTAKKQSLGVDSDHDEICICTVIKNSTDSNASSCENLLAVSSSAEEADCEMIDNKWEMLSMQEIYALVSLADIKVSTPIVVNINLDFFTVEPQKPLPIDESIIDPIETHLNSLFCVHSPLDEPSIDSWFNRLAEQLRQTDVDQLLSVTEIPMEMLCQSKISIVKYRLKLLTTELKKLTDIHLKELVDVGVCIVEDQPTDQSKDSVRRLKLCNGYAHSKHSASPTARYLHSCADTEFYLQIEKIVKILQDNIKQPTVISIIRSIRSGTVSHRNQYFLENQLLWKLKAVYRVQPPDIIYHTNLLGGAHGWWLRHHRHASNNSTAHKVSTDNH